MRDAVIVDAVRVPIGKRNGAYADLHPGDLAAHVLTALVQRTGFDPARVDDVVWGCVTQSGEQSGNIGRVALLAADGRPRCRPPPWIASAAPASRQSPSPPRASSRASTTSPSPVGRVDVAGPDGLQRPGPGAVPGFGVGALRRTGLLPGIGAELVADKWGGFSRAQLDEYSVRSHERTAAAIDSGAFDSQLAPPLPGRITADEACVVAPRWRSWAL